MKSRHQPPLPATLDASKRTGFFDLHIDTGDKKEERDRIRMDNVIAETQTAPSINSEELDRLVAEADKAKLKAYVCQNVCTKQHRIMAIVPLTFMQLLFPSDTHHTRSFAWERHY